MNKDIVKGNVDQAKGEVKEQWGHLTDDDSKVAEGKIDKVKGKVREGVGNVKDGLAD
jgi:uncharacterized protein YjbJ (UPF0337 family)